MKTKLFALALLAGGCLFAQPRFYAGVRVGYAAPAPVVMYAAPPAPLVSYATPAPGPGYAWVGGYWYPNGARYAWHAGYWARPAFAGARWYGPRYAGGRYYGGYWRR
jgi:WXXGXW repeat (2 copies)